jgi:hypothetical protein
VQAAKDPAPENLRNAVSGQFNGHRATISTTLLTLS